MIKNKNNLETKILKNKAEKKFKNFCHDAKEFGRNYNTIAFRILLFPKWSKNLWRIHEIGLVTVYLYIGYTWILCNSWPHQDCYAMLAFSIHVLNLSKLSRRKTPRTFHHNRKGSDIYRHDPWESGKVKPVQHQWRLADMSITLQQMCSIMPCTSFLQSVKRLQHKSNLSVQSQRLLQLNVTVAYY